MWLKIGELARRTGLTVRTLHHYDHIGLLSPSGRSGGGFRLYGRDDVERLHRILVLRQLGYALDDIRQLLAVPEPDPRLLDRQIAFLDRQLRQTQILKARLERLRARLAEPHGVEIGDWLSILEMMAMLEKHLSPEELQTLREQEARSGGELNRVWTELMTAVSAAMAQGATPDSETGRELGWRWGLLLRDITGNDVSLALKLRDLYVAESRAQQIRGLTPTMMGWLADGAAHAHVALLAPFLSKAEQQTVLQRQRRHGPSWAVLIAEVRQAMRQGMAVDDERAQALARRWLDLFADSYFGDDKQLESRVRRAFLQEPRLTQHIGVDQDLISWVHRAMEHVYTPFRTQSDNRAPKPSAFMVAVQRAAHQWYDRPLVFTDPMAMTMAGEVEAEAIRTELERFDNPFALGLRTALAVRSRLAEDLWAEAERRGVRQYVILGAGLDTYAYRGAAAPDTQVFEVDLPDTQQWKRAHMAECGIAEPASVRYVPVCFERQTLADALQAAGFKHDEPAFFSWLGVVMYLEPDAVMQTLAFIAGCPAGSGVVFDYSLASSAMGALEQSIQAGMVARLAQMGEPVKSFFEPAALCEKLEALGFALVDDYSAQRLNQHYLAGREDNMHYAGISHIMHAARSAAAE
ncbi:SAM-dependent methyltransferase [Paludibacterium purpuratum]|uniref:MerR family transcriptional regulator n=1 Tax=Paludibacterium purpuratum TaxID=1144873 RepID=A0A4R7AYT8_9NEIS|nr:SAM-dependent methyltransferase [Paludibacterium purpuratum]TDR73269.1 MerR family transcriptional regulator [Paludibacterium purpuratum]